MALIAAVIVFAPVRPSASTRNGRVWPFIVVTSMLQLLYFALLATAYRKAELSFVYRSRAALLPRSSSSSRRGTRARPRRLRRSPASPSSASACSSFAACGRLPPARARVRARHRLRDRVLHAARQARITHASPITYLELSMIPAALGYAGATLVVKGARVRAELGARPFSPACASFAAYALVLAALERASAASVAAVRETSVVIATASRRSCCSERVSRWRLAGSVLVVCGIALARPPLTLSEWIDGPTEEELTVATVEEPRAFIRPDGKEKVTGTGRYTADLVLAGELVSEVPLRRSRARADHPDRHDEGAGAARRARRCHARGRSRRV